MKCKRLFIGLMLLFGLMPKPNYAQNSLSFDGVDDRVDCGNDTSVQITGSAITLEAWIYPAAWKPNVWQGCIINKENNAPNQGYMLRCGDNGRLNFNLGNVSWYELTTDEEVLELNVWQHVAGSYDGAMMRLFVDGVQIDSLATTVSIANSPQNLIVGDYTGLNREFQGLIDEVRIWNIFRSQTEIEALMNSEICIAPEGLQAYYKFNQGTPGGDNTGEDELIDHSGNLNHGDLVNFALTGTASNWADGKVLAAEVDAELTVASCDSYTVPSGDETYTDLGTYIVYDTVTNVFSGCDSLLTINLTIGDSPTYAALTASGCESYTVPSGDETYTDAGTYTVTDTLVNATGCDSILTIELTVAVETYAAIEVIECDSYTLPSGGGTYITPGTYTLTDVITSAAGCDSTISISLTIMGESTSDETVSTCDSYTSPGGETYTEPGTYTIVDTLTTEHGCDSIITIDLTIEELNTLVTVTDPVLTADVVDVEYQWVDCDDDFSAIPEATDQSYTAVSNGNYAVIITDGACVDTSDCHNIVSLGISDEWLQGKVIVSPNPANHNFSVDLGKTVGEALITISDIEGRLVLTQQVYNQQLIQLNANYPSGVYIVTVLTGDGKIDLPLIIE